MFCPKCGWELSDSQRFCPKCGTQVSGAPAGGAPAGPPAEKPPAGRSGSTTAVKEKQKSKSKAPLLAVAAVLVAAALFLLPKLFSPSETPAKTEEDPPVQAGGDLPEEVDPGPMSQNGEAELLGYIDQAQKLIANSVNEDADNQDIEPYIRYQKDAGVMNTLLKGLTELQEKAGAVSGLDAKLRRAGEEYFNMMCSSTQILAKTDQFWADYLQFYEEVVAMRPQASEYTIGEYAVALGDWSQETKEGYAAISYPACMESEWTQYGAILEYNEAIANKMEQAVYYNDWFA